MLPFYLIFNKNPFGGTIFQSLLSILAIYVSFKLTVLLFNKKIALFASYFCAVSPLFADYSRAVFNAHPALLFSGLALLLMVGILKKYSFSRSIVLGIILGFSIQMHYLTVSLLLFSCIYPLICRDFPSDKKIIYILTVLLGLVIGLLPLILFEIRHNFLNTTLIIDYLFKSGHEGSERNIINSLVIWPELGSKLMFPGYKFSGLIIMVFAVFLVKFYGLYKKYKSSLTFLGCLFIIVITVSLLYGRRLETHYVISFQIPLIIIYSLAAYALSQKRLVLSFICFITLFIINMPAYNFFSEYHPLQQGLGIYDFSKAAEIISVDTDRVFNVSMLAQKDNRAMPLRYYLHIKRKDPLSYENYDKAYYLYIILPKEKKPSEVTTWEYNSFGGNKIIKSWLLNRQYVLYKISRE
jgi:4-amino-4-deoxy-L-arabinose transferase-like glycosyltransferase